MREGSKKDTGCQITVGTFFRKFLHITTYISIRISCHSIGLRQGYTNFPKIYNPPTNSRCQAGDMKQVPCWPKNVRHHHKKFSPLGDLLPSLRILIILFILPFSLCFTSHDMLLAVWMSGQGSTAHVRML